MNFESVERIAAAILYEGYILYPYRPTAIKNRQRWNFGTLYPRSYAEVQRPAEPYALHAECLVVADSAAHLDVRISFLQLVRQQRSTAASLDSLHALSDVSLEWEEAIERTSEHRDLRLSDLIISPLRLSVRMGRNDVSGIQHAECSEELKAQLTIAIEALTNGALKVSLDFENLSSIPDGAQASRKEVLPQSFVSAHVLLGIADGEFISLLDPAEIYSSAVAACHNVGVFPVLAGEEPDRSIMFCSPIILYDYPRIAPESEGDFFDGTEMDEMLTLRVLTLTDAEKEQMRGGDPRARRILERTEALTAESMLRSHGVIRSLRDIRRTTE